MLHHGAVQRPPAVCADAAQLPFRNDSFDHVIAAFVLNHVPDLVSALAELARIVRPGGSIAASSFPAGRQHPAKDAIGTVIAAAGFVPPEWFATFKAEREGPSGSEDALQRAASAAGLAQTVVHDLDVDISGVGAEGLAAYRLGMAQVQPFLGSLAAAQRADAERAAAAAAAPFLDVPMPMLALVARVQG
jgi:SAM-dependent methyltransferase